MTSNFKTISQDPLFWPKSEALPVRNLRRQLSQGQLFWREVGRGPLVLLLHGSWHDSSQWLELMQSLGQHYHCLAPDLIGFGESSRLSLPSYSVELEVDCLAEWLRSQRLTPTIIIGHSLGAWVATRYAQKHPNGIDQLILLAPEGLSPTLINRRWQRHKRLLQRVSPIRAWLAIRRTFAKLLGKATPKHPNYALREQLRQFPAACQLLFNRRQAALQAELLDDKLSTLAIPTSLIAGDYTDDPTTQLTQAYLNAIPNAQLHLVEGQIDPANNSVAIATVITGILPRP
jgi:pimeloyl-ACP methyl ester carboxylesterase